MECQVDGADDRRVAAEVTITLLAALAFLVVVAGLIVSTVIAVQKGKIWMAVCGWLLAVPLGGLGLVLVVIAAIRIAKPGSRWALRRYADDPDRQTLAQVRFPKSSGKPGLF